jgi:uncharacterized protein
MGDGRLVKTLIANGAAVDERSASDMTPLMFAAKELKVEAIKILIAAGADVNARVGRYGPNHLKGMTAAHLAVTAARRRSRKMEAILEALIRAGADVNARDGIRWTPLHYAVTIPRGRMVAILIAAGADPNSNSPEGTPLALLCEASTKRSLVWVARCRQLMRAGADPFIPRSRPPHDAAMSIALAAGNLPLIRALGSRAGVQNIARKQKGRKVGNVGSRRKTREASGVNSASDGQEMSLTA